MHLGGQGGRQWGRRWGIGMDSGTLPWKKLVNKAAIKVVKHEKGVPSIEEMFNPMDPLQDDKNLMNPPP